MHSAAREAYREQLLQQLEEEREFVRKMERLGAVNIAAMPRMKAKDRIRFLQWIGRCTATSSHSFVTADGYRIRLVIPGEEDVAVLHSEDGDLTMRNYTIEVTGGGAVHG